MYKVSKYLRNVIVVELESRIDYTIYVDTTVYGIDREIISRLQ